jgi:hypothetical protein
MIINMDTPEKLTKFLDYKGEKLLDFDNGLYDRYNPVNERLEGDQYKYGYQVSKSDFLNAVDSITSVGEQGSDFQTMNILYDTRTNKIAIYRTPKWEYYLLDAGVSEIVRTLKSNYLDSYEQYLVKKLSTSLTNLPQFQSQLNEYFKLIIAFDYQPYVSTMSDQEILGVDNYNESDGYSLSNQYKRIYDETRKNLPRTELNKIKREVTDIIKVNTRCNLEKLNQAIMDLLKVDEEFQKLLP